MAVGTFEWGDETLDKDFAKDDASSYSAKEGYEDLIRIVYDTEAFYAHRLKAKPYNLGCSKHLGKCEGCTKDIPRKQRAGTLLVHIGRRRIDDPNASFSLVGVVKPWMFSKDRKDDLASIVRKYPQINQMGGIKAVDFYFSCADSQAEQFQNIKILPTLQPSQMTEEMLGNLNAAKDKLMFYCSPPKLEYQQKVLESYASTRPVGVEAPVVGAQPVADTVSAAVTVPVPEAVVPAPGPPVEPTPGASGAVVTPDQVSAIIDGTADSNVTF